jgi:hypothetical protein
VRGPGSGVALWLVLCGVALWSSRTRPCPAINVGGPGRMPFLARCRGFPFTACARISPD